MSAQFDTLKKGGLEKDRQASKAIKNHDELVNKVFNRLNVQLLQKVSEMLNNADGSLELLSENAESEELKIKYRRLMDILRDERGNIDKAFFIAINGHKSSEDQSGADDLSLVDQDEMDEMVMITT